MWNYLSMVTRPRILAITYCYIPHCYFLVMVNEQISRFIYISNEKSEDDINGKEDVNHQINVQKYSCRCFLEG